MDFNAFVNDIEVNSWNVFGVEVYKKGELIHSYGDTCDNIHELFSATKTILSIAVGIAFDRGLFNLDRSVLDYFPFEIVNKLPSEQKEAYKNISIKRLLTMSVAGYPFRPETDDYVEFSLNVPLVKPEEKIFNYNNICAYLVGVALHYAVGEDLAEFIDRNILKPLGITNYKFGRCPKGFFYGASQMEMTVHDFSKIGIILYNKGMYEGKRIVSEEYVNMASSVQQTSVEGGYGYFMWKYRNGFSINGKWKQKCYILPNEELMITYLSHIEDESCQLRQSMEKYLLD